MENLLNLFNNGLIHNKKQFSALMERLARKQSYNYEELGKLMEQYGIIDIFLERSNRTYTNLGYSFLCIDKKTAMKEFDPRKNHNPSYHIIMEKYFQLILYIEQIQNKLI